MTTQCPATSVELSPALQCEVTEFGKNETAGQFEKQEGVWSLRTDGVELRIEESEKGALRQWALKVKNQSDKIRRLKFRWTLKAGAPGGVWWDGFGANKDIRDSIAPAARRNSFPVGIYRQADGAAILGYAPQTMSSRFEGGVEVREGEVYLVWDSWLALHPKQEDEQFFLSGLLEGATNYTEAVEAVYRQYPDFFKPSPHADRRLYGVGGYSWGHYYADADTYDFKMEESRRLAYSWEWLYAPFQKVGDIWPSEKYWDGQAGFSIKHPEGKVTNTATLEDWRTAYRGAMKRSDQVSAMFYYYLPYYSNVKVLEDMPNSLWKDPGGKTKVPIFGWIKSGQWVQRAWPGKTAHGDKTRHDLAQAWENLDIAGFAMDMTMGNISYAGTALPKERGKAFDDSGRVYVTEGIAISELMDFTRALPLRDGGQAAAIANEPVSYLPIFHADAVMHEKPPFEGTQVAAARRFLAGQKPLHWWDPQGYVPQDNLDWERLSPEEFRSGLDGILKYVLFSSLRYGGIPTIFFVDGYTEMREWIPVLRRLQKAGWRAAPYLSLTGETAFDKENPYAEDADVWFARYGEGKEHFLAFAVPALAGYQGKASIQTAHFAMPGLVYAGLKDGVSRQEVSNASTTLALDLKYFDAVVYEGVAQVESSESVALNVERRDSEVLLTPASEWPKGTRITFLPTGESRSASGTEMLSFEFPSPCDFLPDKAWLGEIVLGLNNKSEAVIVLPEGEREVWKPALTQLEVYWAYYRTRKQNPIAELSKLTVDRKLFLPLVESMEVPEAANAKTLFILTTGGDRASWTAAKRGEQWQITLRAPDAESGQQAVTALLEQLDKRFPYTGTIPPHKWFQKANLSGKSFAPEHKQTNNKIE